MYKLIPMLVVAFILVSCNEAKPSFQPETKVAELHNTFAAQVFNTLDHMAEKTGMAVNHPNAKSLITGIGCVESDLMYRKQFGDGPARGLLQFEEDSAYAEAAYYCNSKPKLKAYVERYFGKNHSFKLIENNDRYSIVMARIYFMRLRDEIPESVYGQACYWKQYWNTSAGKGTVDKYINKWDSHN